MWRYFAHFLPKCWKTLINKKGFFEKVREKINVFMWKEIKVINPRKIEAWGSIKVTGDTWERALWRMVTLEKYGMQNQWSTKEAIGPMVWVYGIHQSFMGNICWKDILYVENGLTVEFWHDYRSEYYHHDQIQLHFLTGGGLTMLKKRHVP